MHQPEVDTRHHPGEIPLDLYLKIMRPTHRGAKALKAVAAAAALSLAAAAGHYAPDWDGRHVRGGSTDAAIQVLQQTELPTHRRQNALEVIKRSTTDVIEAWVAATGDPSETLSMDATYALCFHTRDSIAALREAAAAPTPSGVAAQNALVKLGLSIR